MSQTQATITKEMIQSAEHLIGLSFTETERDQMLGLLNDRLNVFEKLRQLPLSNDVPMGLYFDPYPASTDMTQAERHYNVPDVEIERSSNLEDLAFCTIPQLAYLLKTKQVTSVELTEMYLARLKRFDKQLECVITFTEELAMEQARRADDEIEHGIYRSPLHGIPWGAKDLFAVEGYPTTWGAVPFKDQSIDTTATIVKRLEEAGAVLIAKLSLGALAFGDIWFGGVTKNPWNTDEGSGGSSAGSSAATAAGLVGFAIGTETLGSIINPSTRCGVTGFRPTFGRVSRHGAMALCWSLDKIGPICRSVEGTAIVFTAIHGQDGFDRSVKNQGFTWPIKKDPKTIRIGYVPASFDPNAELQPQALGSHNVLNERNQQNTHRVVEELKQQGFELVPVTLPEKDYSPLFIVLLAEAAAAFDELTRNNLDDLLTRQDDGSWANLFRAARFIPAVEYIQASRLRETLIAEFNHALRDVDVLVTPAFGDNIPLITNMTGHPALSLPNGLTSDGMPTSISFIGKHYQDDIMLAVGHAYQQATAYHQAYPPQFS